MSDDLVKRATFVLSDMQGRMDATKLAVFADCIDRIEELEAENARLRETLEVFADDRNWFDATEDNIRYPAWRGPVDDPEEFARATLAEQEKADE